MERNLSMLILPWWWIRIWDSVSLTHARIAYSAASQFCSAFSLTTMRDFPRTCSEKNDSVFFKKYIIVIVCCQVRFASPGPGDKCRVGSSWQKKCSPTPSFPWKNACTGSRFLKKEKESVSDYNRGQTTHWFFFMYNTNSQQFLLFWNPLSHVIF